MKTTRVITGIFLIMMGCHAPQKVSNQGDDSPSGKDEQLQQDPPSPNKVQTPPDSLLNGIWSFSDVIREVKTTAGSLEQEERTRVNEDLDSVEVRSGTLYKVSAGKTFLFGSLTFEDSSQIEYIRRCCRDGKTNNLFKIDSISQDYVRISQRHREDHDSNNPGSRGMPFPRPEPKPAVEIKEFRVVVMERLE